MTILFMQHSDVSFGIRGHYTHVGLLKPARKTQNNLKLIFHRTRFERDILEK